MSRQNPRKQNGIKLPFALRKELGLQDDRDNGRGRGRGGKSTVMNRKIQRKSLRAEKKHGGRLSSKGEIQNNDRFGNDLDELEEDDDDSPVPKSTSSKSNISRPAATVATAGKEVKSILKKPQRRIPSPEDSDSEQSRASSPGLVLDANSKSFRQHAAEDDAEIIALERRLGMKGKNKAKMGDDMLDYVLEGLDEEDDGRKRKREGQDWLNQKRRKIKTNGDEGLDSDAHSGDADSSLGHEEEDQEFLGLDDEVTDGHEDYDDEQDALNDSGEGEDFVDGLDDLADGLSNVDDAEEDDDVSNLRLIEEEYRQSQTVKKIRENPYVAPVAAGTVPSKYVPPSLRMRAATEQTGSEILKRQLQGHLNKLSEANIISILGEVEKLYRSNPRQDMTTVLIDLILTSFCIPSALQNTFIILNAAFLTAVYKVIGTDFGAELLVRTVERFNQEYQNTNAGKEALNIISLLANLFTFGLVSNHVVYDHVRLLLSNFSEANAELLLRVVRDCGPQLRSDDPLALKGIVQTMQDISADMARNGQTINIRTRVMMDTITDLKNNKMKNATNAAGMTGEHITRMRKALGSLNNRSLKATEPMRITRDDIANSDKKGKWWLVGASWKGNDSKSDTLKTASVEVLMGDHFPTTEDEVDLLALAKQYRMNTDVRRSIFVAVMSANDIRDAQTRLLKLRLSTKQEQEIAKVLLRCARAEPAYNHYYTLLAKNLSKENKKIRVGLQFGLWDFFGRMGERADEESDDEADTSSIELYEIVNIAKMYAYLIFHGHMTIGVLKTLNIGFLRDQATMFLEVLLISMLNQPKSTEEDLIRVFSGARETPQIIKGLRYFMKKNVRKSDLVLKNDRDKIKAACGIAEVALKMVDSAVIE